MSSTTTEPRGTPGTHGTGPLPTQADVAAVEKMLSQAFNGLEDLRLRIERRTRESEPSLELVGSLLLFQHHAAGQGAGITDEAEALKDAILELDDRRYAVGRRELDA